MKSRYFIVGLLVVTIFLIGWSSLCLAQDIKTRFKDRLPKILELKAEGIVGETNRGYLDFVGGNRKMQDIVDAENSDRRSVYEGIAKQQGVSIEVVGQRRALQLRDLAASGHFYQDDAGNWKRK